MSDEVPFPTWSVLQEFGFEADAEVVYSDIRPGLSFDFGNFKLSACAVMNLGYAEVVMFTGVMATPRTLAEVQFEMPRQIQSREKCAAWLAWNLDTHVDGRFEPHVAVPWLELGRANFRLLPWFFDQEAYEARPHCGVDQELARPMLKKLAEFAARMGEEEKVWFSFDGEVLKIRCGRELLAAAAKGRPWTEEFGIKPARLTKLPRRLTRPTVWFESWENRFNIGDRRYSEVVARPFSKQ
jgi:hypothetical protein